jgi:glycosyltransferase involved in cell wall biosynthesis
MKISAVLVTYNEADKAKGCLASLKGFVDEIVIIDLGSTDDIQELSRQYQARLISHKRVPYVELVRNYSISQTTGDWVLVLDPDERMTKELCDYLYKVAKGDDFDAVNVPFKNIFWGHWIAHTNFWPDKHIRFFRKGYLTWEEKIHSYPKVNGRLLEMPLDEKLAVNHLGYVSRSQFFSKQFRYAKAEAENLLSQGRGFSVIKLIWMPLREFLARYVKHQGFKDGVDGIFLVFSLMLYQVMVQLNVLKLSLSKR